MIGYVIRPKEIEVEYESIDWDNKRITLNHEILNKFSSQVFQVT